MSEFFDRLSELMEKRRFRQSDITKALGYSSANFSTWRNGSIPRAKVIRDLADFFSVSPEYLMGLTDDIEPTEGEKPIIETYDVTKVRLIPLFSGIPECDDIFSETKYIDDKIPCSNNLQPLKNLFAITATNDTMAPIINVGDIIIAQLTSDCECDDLCIYRMYGNIGVRWISFDDSQIVLEAENSQSNNSRKGYKNIIISKDKTSDFDFELIGKIVEVRKIMRNLHHIRN